jgi:ABC-type transport system involved in multi-copper enzyme maturation permease subunit
MSPIASLFASLCGAPVFGSLLLGVWESWVYPLGWVALGVATAVGLLWGVYGCLLLVLPKMAAIARTTAKESLQQPLFWVEIALGTMLLPLFALIPYNTFGDDIKLMKESGLTLIMLLAMLMAVWSSSVSIADELEGRTALTLLSKPLSRRQFILGKFLGVLAPVYIMFVALGAIFLLSVSFKVGFDVREVSTLKITTAEQSALEMGQIVPGMILAFFEAVVMASISVAISTRLPMVPNLVICSSIYVVGHLVPLLVQSSVGQLPIVTFVGQFLATVLPVLDHFNVQAAVATGREVPLEYLGWAFLYCALYSSIAMLVALIMFEDRDLA